MMTTSRTIRLLLATLLLGQSVLAGFAHRHCHDHSDQASHAHAHAGSHSHSSHDSQPLPPVEIPADEDDCTLCRYLAESSLLTIDSGLLEAGRVATPVSDTDESFVSRDIVGLRRPRSPPQLG